MLMPPGFNTVTPYFFVTDAEAFVAFLVTGLGGTEILRHMRDNQIANAQVRVGTSTVMVSEASEIYPAMSGAYYLYVENVEKAVSQAVAAGAELIMEIQEMPYQDRQGGVRDAHGNIWWLSQRLVDAPY